MDGLYIQQVFIEGCLDDWGVNKLVPAEFVDSRKLLNCSLKQALCSRNRKSFRVVCMSKCKGAIVFWESCPSSCLFDMPEKHSIGFDPPAGRVAEIGLCSRYFFQNSSA